MQLDRCGRCEDRCVCAHLYACERRLCHKFLILDITQEQGLLPRVASDSKVLTFGYGRSREIIFIERQLAQMKNF